MTKLSLKYRIAITIFLLEIIMMAAVLRVTLGHVEEETRVQFDANQEVLLELLVGLGKIALLTEAYPDFQQHLTVLTQEPRIVAVSLADTEVIVASSLVDHLGRRANATLGDDWVSTQILFGRQQAGMLHVRYDNAMFKASITKAHVLGAAVALIGMLLVAIVSVLMGGLLTKRLNVLTQAAQEISHGSLLVRVPDIGTDELGHLSHVFNSMSAKISRQIDALRWQRKALERTNENLSKEIELKRLAETSLQREKGKVDVTCGAIGDGVITTDSTGKIDYINRVALDLTGMTFKQALGRPIDDVFRRIDAQTRAAIGSTHLCLTDGKVYESREDNLLLRADGAQITIRDSVAPLRDYHGGIIGCVAVFQDLTQARLIAHEMNYQSTHDDLTGLLNRREFEARITQALADYTDQGTDATLLYLDLDQFKIINDSYGHSVGDELLQVLSASVLREELGGSDILARLGGDEFGVLLLNRHADHAVGVAEAIREAIKTFRFFKDGQYISIGVSIGLVPFSASMTHVSAVLGAADAACYVAKASGRDRIHCYSPDDEQLARHQKEMKWVSRIAHAFEENRFSLVFQPIELTTSTQSICHFEILVRLRDEHGKMVKPDNFLPAAERFTLMSTLDRWVVRQTFRWLAEHPHYIEKLDCCSINLSGNTLGDEYFLEFLLNQFADQNIPKRKICFEITETAAIMNLDFALELMHTLRAQGCRFALDDFGAGLSSFAYLKNFPVDYVKIDGTFVRHILSDPIDDAMVRSINEIGHILDKETIAEYVESDDIRQRLATIGVNYVQGYAVSRYLHLDAFEEYYLLSD